jgi:uncharacterized membrane protein YphA (DoxX/SURF4 family)
LRIAPGLQFIVLAAHDKLLDPRVSLAFVDKYCFVNLPAPLRLSDFTNLHFFVGAGMIEVAFGTLLLLNVATRSICVILMALLVLTGILFGLGELFGHVPIAAAIAVVAWRGQVSGAGPTRNRSALAWLGVRPPAATSVPAGPVPAISPSVTISGPAT